MGHAHRTWYDRKIRRVRDLPCGDLRIYLEVDLRRVACRRCGGMKQERLDWLAANPHYTRRFALYVGKQCRSASIKEVAEDLRLDWHAVKEMDKLYMYEQLQRAPRPRPGIIGVDEIAIRKGHVYRIVVSDLERELPIWFGGIDRSEESLAMFYAFLGTQRSEGIRLAVMDMWKAFRKATSVHTPQATILHDKFHVLRHLNEAMDKVRKAEYKRLTNRADRTYIKGQKYVLLSRRANLSPEQRQRLKTLLAANKRLNTAYVLKEQFGQLWTYRREAWARRFFEQWRASLKWQRLQPFEDFAAVIDRHWDGIAMYCRPENKVSLGFVEGLNNKSRAIQRRAYGPRDEDYLHLKILTFRLPPLPRSEIPRNHPHESPKTPIRVAGESCRTIVCSGRPAWRSAAEPQRSGCRKSLFWSTLRRTITRVSDAEWERRRREVSGRSLGRCP
ncbi:MAG: ISL3 family transposase, partial [Gemmatimonadaceae bacterium]|nr:ISL3 family transposase [Gemmatimonadaceae bacterium]